MQVWLLLRRRELRTTVWGKIPPFIILMRSVWLIVKLIHCVWSLSGRELFLSNASLFVDDAEAFEEYQREKEEEEIEQKVNSLSLYIYHLKQPSHVNGILNLFLLLGQRTKKQRPLGQARAVVMLNRLRKKWMKRTKMMMMMMIWTWMSLMNWKQACPKLRSRFVSQTIKELHIEMKIYVWEVEERKAHVLALCTFGFWRH